MKRNVVFSLAIVFLGSAITINAVEKKKEHVCNGFPRQDKLSSQQKKHNKKVVRNESKEEGVWQYKQFLKNVKK